MFAYRFQFRLVPTLAMLVGLAMFIYLGLWQAGKGDRLAAELAQQAARHQLGVLPVTAVLLDANAVQHAPITVVGEFEPQQQFFLDNRQEGDLPGVHVITPLKIDGSDTRILVNRGWVGWAHGRGVLPVVATPAGKVQVSGVAFVPSGKKFFLMPDRSDAASRLWSRLDMARAGQMLGAPLQPVVLLQNKGDTADTLLRNWVPTENRVGMHRGYAFQWFGMALALLVFFLVVSFRKRDV